jgi:hypothetical protein
MLVCILPLPDWMKALFTEGHELDRKWQGAEGDDRTQIVAGGSEEVVG